ncbi:MAG: hypothetical protein U5K74_08605 [Gemmatimonadaceae bacterium]|nr:hypothetical protein [Gemmatimonadaceae bacterium]
MTWPCCRVLQRDILAAASSCVKPGGLLIYSTCSLEREENDAVVNEFLADDDSFVLEPPPSGYRAGDGDRQGIPSRAPAPARCGWCVRSASSPDSMSPTVKPRGSRFGRFGQSVGGLFSRRPILMTAISGFLVGFAAVALWLLPQTLIRGESAVPNVVGLLYSDAAARLSAAGFSVKTGGGWPAAEDFRAWVDPRHPV